MGLFWKDGHLWWHDGHLAWDEKCCNCYEVRNCATDKLIRVPDIISVTLGGLSGTRATGKCGPDFLGGVSVPQMVCDGTPTTRVCGYSGNRCQVHAGTWEIYDKSCSLRFGEDVCVANMIWCFCSEDCPLNNGGVGLQAYLFADPISGIPRWGFNNYYNDNACPLVNFYDTTWRSAELSLLPDGITYNAVGSFALTHVTGGYSPASVTAGNPCGYATTVTLNAG